MADGRHIENRFLEEAELRSDTGHVTKIPKFELKSAQRDTNLRAGTLQPDRTF